jgi:putative PIN family toxin of toxin-antitoxin system
VRAVLDTNILVAALISRTGTPAALVLSWLNGEFELVISEQLLAELARALAYPRIQKRVSAPEAAAFIQLLRESTTIAVDPEAGPQRSRDAGDDYLIRLAESCAAVLVSGDDDLLELAPALPVMSAAGFAAQLRNRL